MTAESLHWHLPPSRTRPGTITVHRDGQTFTARLWSGSDVAYASPGHESPSAALDALLALWREERRAMKDTILVYSQPC